MMDVSFRKGSRTETVYRSLLHGQGACYSSTYFDALLGAGHEVQVTEDLAVSLRKCYH